MERPRRTTWLQGAVLAVPVLGVLAAGWHYRWMNEDGFIYLRIVRQIEAGHGPVFNVGERVEAYTGTLWVAYLTVADLVLPMRLEWIAVLSGLAMTAAGVVLMMAGSRRLWGRSPDGWLLPVGALVFVVVTPVWIYATSGLENGLAFAWIGACTYVLGRWVESDRSRLGAGGAVVLGLGWLVRPELVLLSAVLLVGVVVADWRTDGWGGRFRVAAAAMAVPLAYQLFRMGYFGAVVPNTGIAKEGGRVAFDRGWNYFRDFVDPYLLFLPLVALAIGAYAPQLHASWKDRDRRRVVATVGLVAGGCLAGASLVVLGGDYHHGRLLLAPFMAVLAPVAVVPVARRHAVAGIAAVWAVVAAVALRPEQYGDDAFANGIAAPRPGLPIVLSIEPGDHFDRLRVAVGTSGTVVEADGGQFPPLGLPVAADRPPPSVALRAIGGNGLALDLDVYVLDRLGLADALTARLEVPHPTVLTLAGHEKPLPDPWLVARWADPGAELTTNPLPVWSVALWERSEGQAFVEQVAWARAALGCADLAELDEAIRAPLSVGRVVENILGAFGRTSMRVPLDPEDAYHRFCGDGVPPEVVAVRDAEQ